MVKEQKTAKISPLKILQEDLLEANKLKNNLLADLAKTNSLSQTAKNFGYSHGSTIGNFLKAMSVDISKFERVKFTKEQELIIINEYIAGKSITELSKFYKVTRGKITCLLKKYHVVLRTKQEAALLASKQVKFEFDLNRLSELVNFYKTHTINETAKWLGCKNIAIVKRIFKENNIQLRTKQESYLLGADATKQACLKKYGVEYAITAPKVTEKIRATVKSKYNVDNVFQAREIKDKIRQTNLEKYGVEQAAKNNFVIQKAKQTNLKKYNCIHPNQLKEKQELCKEKCRQIYGVDFYFQTEEFKEKAKQTNLKRYGVENGGASKEAQEKIYKTKKKNHTFNTSKPEEIFYKKLIKKYSTQDVLRQYKDPRYPFMCDFYIKSKDLFIELNLHWTHGGHKFDKNSSKDLQKLNLWQEKAKTSNFYKSAIYVWTERDLYKLEIAKKANLNYKVIYSLKNYDL